MKLFHGQKLKNAVTGSIDVPALSSIIGVDSSKLSKLTTDGSGIDGNSITGKALTTLLDKISNVNPGSANTQQEILKLKVETCELDSKLKDLARVNSVSQKLQGTRYDKLSSSDDIKASIIELLESSDETKAQVLADFKAGEKSGGGLMSFMNINEHTKHIKGDITDGTANPSIKNLLKYWFFMFLVMLGLSISGIAIVNTYSELVENKVETDTGEKLKNVVKYIFVENFWSIVWPCIAYCMGRLIYDISLYHPIPFIGYFINLEERVFSFAWTGFFSVVIVIIFYRATMSADLGNPECPAGADKPDSYKKRCFPFLWDKECPDKDWSVSCWFKI